MAERPNPNPTPKSAFLVDKAKVSGHWKLLDNPSLFESMDVALLEYQRTLLSAPLDAGSASAIGLKLKGAQEFMDTFLRLGQPSAPPQLQTMVAKLDHRA